MARRIVDNDREIVIVGDEGSDVVPFLIGAAVGAVIALLFAPASGEETQRRLRQTFRTLRDTAQDKMDELAGSVEERVDEFRESARDAVDAGRGAVESAREELERRLEEARSRRGTQRGPSRVPDDEDEPVA